MEENKVLLVNVLVLAMEKSFYFICDDSSFNVDDLVIVETTRGIELGKVVESPIEHEVKENEEYPHVIKKGDPSDYKLYEINIEKSKEAVSFVQEESNKLNLDMKIISAEYMLDGTKIIIYYLADNRVDFRELLKVLANELKCRIELRQIGTRDKAKMIGGIGICGLKLCCATFLNEFDGISITMAKNQMLALNIPKLSGHCGKLICCLKFENDTYTELQKDLPRVGSKVKYNDEIFKITSMNVITKIIRLENKDNILSVPYEEIKDCILPKDYIFAPNQQFKHQHGPRPMKKEGKKDAKN
ncbi:MAG: stage 0 sporulation protein [Erysipelotrichaceae bacterium]|nr:stage 0 sporulation protein [Erysipelotrichaceae bacterium]